MRCGPASSLVLERRNRGVELLEGRLLGGGDAEQVLRARRVCGEVAAERSPRPLEVEQQCRGRAAAVDSVRDRGLGHVQLLVLPAERYVAAGRSHGRLSPTAAAARRDKAERERYGCDPSSQATRR